MDDLEHTGTCPTEYERERCGRREFRPGLDTATSIPPGGVNRFLKPADGSNVVLWLESEYKLRSIVRKMGLADFLADGIPDTAVKQTVESDRSECVSYRFDCNPLIFMNI